MRHATTSVSIPRPRRGGDFAGTRRSTRRARFNPRPRRGGDWYVRCSRSHPPCFNPRPAGGGDVQFELDPVPAEEVSIHAPAGGATATEVAESLRSFLFQSTPPQGGDENQLDHRVLVSGFNPRPAGGRLRFSSHHLQSLQFQSTPPQGGRPPAAYHPPDHHRVSSTPPQGGRRIVLAPFQPLDSFNPRPRRGATSAPRLPAGSKTVSIHAPAGGATFFASFLIVPMIVSIHAPAGGRRGDPRSGCRMEHVSIHAPAGGATLTGVSVLTTYMFQSTPPQGGRRRGD